MPCPVLASCIVRGKSDAIPGTGITYGARHVLYLHPVLTNRWYLPTPGIALGARYAMSSTDIGH
eukprot:2691138-Rhodomonas_salina.2